MSDFQASALALQLAAFATRTGGPLPLLDGTSALLSLSGMGFLARPLQRAPEGLWFRQTPTFQALLPGSLDPADQRDFVLVVQWRRLLAKGLLEHEDTDGIEPPLRRLSHQAWWTLLPLIEQHDVVLAQLLRAAAQKFREQPERVTHEPLWVGFDTQADRRRFDAQVTMLLRSRRTSANPHDGFCEVAAQWLAEAMLPAVNQVVQRHLGLCVVNKHVRGGECPTCPEIAKERAFLLALDVPALLDQRVRRTIATTAKPQPNNAPSVVRDNLLWMLHTRSRRDGVYSFQHHNGSPARFIDFQRLRERWAELGMETMFDDLPAPAQIEGSRKARELFSRLVGGALIPEHHYSAKELFLAADLGREEDFNTSYSQFVVVFDTTLLIALQRVDPRAAALVKARMALPVTPTGIRQPRRVVTRTWAPLSGDPPIPIGIIRAMSTNKHVRNFYTLPYDLVDNLVEDSKARRGKGIAYDGQIYWTAQTVNFFANKTTADEEVIYPWAREFCEWIGLQENQLLDDKMFNNAMYSERLPQRLEAVARGDMAHLGAFSQQEDDRILAFFVSNLAKKRLTTQDWQPLLQRLPGRNIRGVLRRFEELGKKYAFQHGYQQYYASPYHRKFASKRRAQWIKEGCPA